MSSLLCLTIYSSNNQVYAEKFDWSKYDGVYRLDNSTCMDYSYHTLSELGSDAYNNFTFDQASYAFIKIENKKFHKKKKKLAIQNKSSTRKKSYASKHKR